MRENSHWKKNAKSCSESGLEPKKVCMTTQKLPFTPRLNCEWHCELRIRRLGVTIKTDRIRGNWMLVVSNLVFFPLQQKKAVEQSGQPIARASPLPKKTELVIFAPAQARTNRSTLLRRVAINLQKTSMSKLLVNLCIRIAWRLQISTNPQTRYIHNFD